MFELIGAISVIVVLSVVSAPFLVIAEEGHAPTVFVVGLWVCVLLFFGSLWFMHDSSRPMASSEYFDLLKSLLLAVASIAVMTLVLVHGVASKRMKVIAIPATLLGCVGCLGLGLWGMYYYKTEPSIARSEVLLKNGDVRTSNEVWCLVVAGTLESSINRCLSDMIKGKQVVKKIRQTPGAESMMFKLLEHEIADDLKSLIGPLPKRPLLASRKPVQVALRIAHELNPDWKLLRVYRERELQHCLVFSKQDVACTTLLVLLMIRDNQTQLPQFAKACEGWIIATTFAKKPLDLYGHPFPKMCQKRTRLYSAIAHGKRLHQQILSNIPQFRMLHPGIFGLSVDEAHVSIERHGWSYAPLNEALTLVFDESFVPILVLRRDKLTYQAMWTLASPGLREMWTVRDVRRVFEWSTAKPFQLLMEPKNGTPALSMELDSTGRVSRAMYGSLSDEQFTQALISAAHYTAVDDRYMQFLRRAFYYEALSDTQRKRSYTESRRLLARSLDRVPALEAIGDLGKVVKVDSVALNRKKVHTIRSLQKIVYERPFLSGSSYSSTSSTPSTFGSSPSSSSPSYAPSTRSGSFGSRSSSSGGFNSGKN